jgi:hypothetical protein
MRGTARYLMRLGISVAFMLVAIGATWSALAIAAVLALLLKLEDRR